MNLPENNDEKDKRENVDFAAILTGREQVPKVYTLDTALATFQSENKINEDKNIHTQNDKDLKYSVKITNKDQINKISIDIGKSPDNADVVAELYKTKNPSVLVNGNICSGKITSKKLKGSLQGKKTKELIRKMEKGEAYVDISTTDKPKGKVRGKIKKLT